MFEESLGEFISWKKQKGFYINVAYTDEIGDSATEIQTYIHELYNNADEENPAPSFVLLCGDIAQIPTFSGTTSSHKTDLYYFTVDDDMIPEMYYGRFSANNIDDFNAQIEKTLWYEKGQFEADFDLSYLGNIVLTAGMEMVAMVQVIVMGRLIMEQSIILILKITLLQILISIHHQVVTLPISFQI